MSLVLLCPTPCHLPHPVHIVSRRTMRQWELDAEAEARRYESLSIAERIALGRPDKRVNRAELCHDR